MKGWTKPWSLQPGCTHCVSRFNIAIVITLYLWLFGHHDRCRIVLEIKWWHIKRTHDGIKYVKRDILLL